MLYLIYKEDQSRTGYTDSQLLAVTEDKELAEEFVSTNNSRTGVFFSNHYILASEDILDNILKDNVISGSTTDKPRLIDKNDISIYGRWVVLSNGTIVERSKILSIENTNTPTLGDTGFDFEIRSLNNIEVTYFCSRYGEGCESLKKCFDKLLEVLPTYTQVVSNMSELESIVREICKNYDLKLTN